MPENNFIFFFIFNLSGSFEFIIIFFLHMLIICIGPNSLAGWLFQRLYFLMCLNHIYFYVVQAIPNYIISEFIILYTSFIFQRKTYFTLFIYLFLCCEIWLFLGQYFINAIATIKHKLCIFHIRFLNKISR